MKKPGVLALTAKVSEPDDWREYCRTAGRLDDLILFDKPYAFNFLQHAVENWGVSEGVAIMSDLVDAASAAGGDKGKPFWIRSSKAQIRNGVVGVYRGMGKVSIADVVAFINDLPTSPAQLDCPKWRQGFVNGCMVSAIRRGFADDIDFDAMLDYVTMFWPKQAPETAGGVTAQSMTVLSPFTTGKLAPLFGDGGIPVSPEIIEKRGGIVVINQTVNGDREDGRMSNLAWKLCTQRQALKRLPMPDMRTMVIVADEASNFAVAGVDAAVQAVARSAGLVNLMAVQNRSLLTVGLGGDHAQAEVDGWLGNFQQVIATQNPCMITNEWMSRLIGQEMKMTYSGGGGGDEPFDAWADLQGYKPKGFNVHWNQTMMPRVRPEELAVLKRGGLPDLMVEAICYLGGRAIDGKTWCRVFFDQTK